MRQLAIGNSVLMDGFALLGIETYADLDITEVEKILTQLLRNKESALIYLQQNLLKADLPLLEQIRNEGGHILISEIPDILSANKYQAPVDHLIARVLGNSAVEELLNGE
jgi:vacuolar-type H+-ATPase subunit F/Vma7